MDLEMHVCFKKSQCGRVVEKATLMTNVIDMVGVRNLVVSFPCVHEKNAFVHIPLLDGFGK